MARRRLQDDCRSRNTAREQVGFPSRLGLLRLGGHGHDGVGKLAHDRKSHTPGERADPDDSLFLCRQLSGDLGLEQQGRAIVLGPGEMTLLEVQRVYRGDFRAGSRLMVLKMPRRAMEARCGDLTALLAQKARPHAGVRSVIPVKLPCLSKGPRPWISRLKRSFARIRWTLSRYLWPQPPAIPPEARLADPGLDPLRPHLAPVLGSSMHTRCFRDRAPRSRGGSTGDGWTAAALLSPTHRTISDIAFGWVSPTSRTLAPCSKGVSACVRANIATRGDSGDTRSNKPSRAAPRLVVLGFDGYIAGMDLSVASSGRLTILVRSALGVLVIVFALATLYCGGIRAGTPTDPLASPGPESAATLAVVWKAVRPRHRSQNDAVPFPPHSDSGKLGIAPAAISVAWLPTEALQPRTISGSCGHLGLRTHNPRDPPAVVAAPEACLKSFL